MKLFESKLINRIALWKFVGFIFWLGGFFIIPLFFSEASLLLSWAILLWYISLWAFIWIFGIWTEYPLFSFKISFWIRWLWLWAWMNFVLALFMYDNLTILMINTAFDWWSPFWIVAEWAFFWLIVDFITTKYIWEWKDLLSIYN